jgi:hypothetical protein
MNLPSSLKVYSVFLYFDNILVNFCSNNKVYCEFSYRLPLKYYFTFFALSEMYLSISLLVAYVNWYLKLSLISVMAGILRRLPRRDGKLLSESPFIGTIKFYQSLDCLKISLRKVTIL